MPTEERPLPTDNEGAHRVGYEAGARGEQLGLSDDELAFYDALEANDSAVKVLGDDSAF